MISVKPTNVLRERLVVTVEHRPTGLVGIVMAIKGHYLGQMGMESPKRWT